jgi:arginase
MAAAATLPLPFPEVATIEEATLAEQSLGVAAALPSRPLVLGGCCCAHVGAVEGLAARYGRLGVVWIDAHGDLNTPESSPSGNEWGMSLRMLIDGGAIEPQHAALVGARKLDPPEEEYIAEAGVRLGVEGIEPMTEAVEAVYVAVDADALDPGEGVAVFMPEPEGLLLPELEDILGELGAGRRRVAGAGLTGLIADPRNAAPVAALCAALGLVSPPVE